MALVAVLGLAGPAWEGPARIVTDIAGGAAIVAGGLLGLRAMSDLHAAFTPLPHPVDGGELVTGGAYGLVRHPMYAAVVLGGLGWGLLTASALAIGAGVALLAFLDLKSRREETWLAAAYPGYEAYRLRTRRIVPFLH
jgi:protein-S-isoprenylcysteine O-methyltransferase Ste14